MYIISIIIIDQDLTSFNCGLVIDSNDHWSPSDQGWQRRGLWLRSVLLRTQGIPVRFWILLFLHCLFAYSEILAYLYYLFYLSYLYYLYYLLFCPAARTTTACVGTERRDRGVTVKGRLEKIICIIIITTIITIIISFYHHVHHRRP